MACPGYEHAPLSKRGVASLHTVSSSPVARLYAYLTAELPHADEKQKCELAGSQHMLRLMS